MFNEAWGVDVAVSTPRIMSALVEEAVSIGDLVRLFRFSQGNANLVELTLPADSPIVGKKVSDVSWPTDTALVTIIRGGSVLRPEGDIPLEAGDELLFVAHQDQETALEDVLYPHVRPKTPLTHGVGSTPLASSVALAGCRRPRSRPALRRHHARADRHGRLEHAIGHPEHDEVERHAEGDPGGAESDQGALADEVERQLHGQPDHEHRDPHPARPGVRADQHRILAPAHAGLRDQRRASRR